MSRPAETPPVLRTNVGEFPLSECRLTVGGRDWSVLHTQAVLSRADEARYLDDPDRVTPYGVALWPAAIALAYEVATRATEIAGKSLLELGAGTGLPGIVAASLGAAVTQTEREELALHVCRLNGTRNGVGRIEYRLADWSAWGDAQRYDWIIASDVLYADTYHAHVRRILEGNLAPGGRVLVADPYRAASLPLLERLAAGGWHVAHARWVIGEGADARAVAVHELSRA